MRKFVAAALLATALTGTSACTPASDSAASSKSGELTELEIAAIVQACETVSNQYAVYLDNKDWENMPKAFAPDGTWEVLGNSMTGPEEIQEYWRSRTADWDEHHGRLHSISNQVIEVIDRDHARGTSKVVIYFFDTRENENASLAPLLIAQNVDEYVRTDDGWKLSLRRIERLANVGN